MATLAVLLEGIGCRHTTCESPAEKKAQALQRLICPAEAPAPPILPFSRPCHRLTDFWLDQYDDETQTILDAQSIERHNRRLRNLTESHWPVGRFDIQGLQLPVSEIKKRFQKKIKRYEEAFRDKKRVALNGDPPFALLNTLKRLWRSFTPADEIRAVHHATALRCLPTNQPLYEKAGDVAFDQLQCSQLHFTEPVRVLGRVKGFDYVWTNYGEGWVSPHALTPPLSPTQIETYVKPEQFVVAQNNLVAVWNLNDPQGIVGAMPLGGRLPMISEEKLWFKVLFPSPKGISEGMIRRGSKVSVGYPPLTRENFFTLAFGLLNTPYGWGGMGNHRDCSRLMMDLFDAFGLHIPRSSAFQAQAGTRFIDVEDFKEADKVRAILEAGQAGLLLLYLPGHIMLYIGQDQNHLYAYHLFSGYITPCKNGGETMQRINRTAVTSLELGRGGSRRSFIERITRLVIFERQDPQSPPKEKNKIQTSIE